IWASESHERDTRALASALLWERRQPRSTLISRYQRYAGFKQHQLRGSRRSHRQTPGPHRRHSTSKSAFSKEVQLFRSGNPPKHSIAVREAAEAADHVAMQLGVLQVFQITQHIEHRSRAGLVV